MKKNIELFLTFFKVGLFTFGGGLSMLPIIEKTVVDDKKWATVDELIDYYAIGQVTPGVIAVNCSTFIGLRVGGIVGAIFATLGIVSPSLIIISILSIIINTYTSNLYVTYFLAGIRVGVCALLINTVIKLSKNTLKNVFSIIICLISLIVSFFTPLPTILIVIACAITGIIYSYKHAKLS